MAGGITYGVDAISMELEEFPDWVNRLAKRVDPATSWRPLLKQFRSILIASTKEQFEQGRSPEGVPWLPRMYTPPRPNTTEHLLKEKGVLYTSLSKEGNQDTINILSDTQLTWGTKDPRAKTHQEGVANLRPTHAKVFAIPWSKEAYQKGSPRAFGRPLVLIWPRKGGKVGWLVEATRSKVKYAHYMLLEYITIPKREFLGISGSNISQFVEATLSHLRIRILGYRLESVGGRRGKKVVD